MHELPVILSRCSHRRENPPPFGWGMRIAAPVCGLVRNDRMHFATGLFSYRERMNCRAVLGVWEPWSRSPATARVWSSSRGRPMPCRWASMSTMAK